MADIWDQLALQIKDWGQEIGFAQIGIADIDLNHAKDHYPIAERGWSFRHC